MNIENIKSEDILRYIEDGIEQCKWNDFIFIDFSLQGILVAGFINNEHETECIFTEVFHEIIPVMNIIFNFFDKKEAKFYEESYCVNWDELEIITKQLMNEKSIHKNNHSNPLGLSTLLIKSGHDDIYIQMFLEKLRPESYVKYGTVELCLHKSIVECVDHMLSFFEYCYGIYDN